MLGFDCLTASEARDLRNTATSETIRARIKLADSRVTQASLMASPPEFAYKINNKIYGYFYGYINSSNQKNPLIC